jgi:hypothetical protein
VGAGNAYIKRIEKLREQVNLPRGCRGKIDAPDRGDELHVSVAMTRWAYGDTAAGHVAAYDQGDYSRAMSEWQSAAGHRDAAAQFGLGVSMSWGLEIWSRTTSEPIIGIAKRRSRTTSKHNIAWH